VRVAAQGRIAASRQGERFGDGSSRTPHGGSDEDQNGFLEAETLDAHRVIGRMREAGRERGRGRGGNGHGIGQGGLGTGGLGPGDG